jgi:beta-lactamase class A
VRVHTPDDDLTGLNRLGQREIGRRGLLLAAPAGLFALAAGSLGADLLTPVGAAGSDLFEAAGDLGHEVLAPGRARRALQEALTPIVGRSGVIGVSVFDRRTGARWAYRADALAPTGSVAKVLVVGAALRKARGQGTALTVAQKEQARLAITQSDNTSASALYEYIGGHAAVADLAADLGMTATAKARVADDWGTTLTTPGDLVTMMSRLVQGTEALHAGDRAYLLDLMGKVVSPQRWGVGSVWSATVKVRMKNGWMAVDNPWVINSVGDVRGAGRDYCLAIMQRAQPTQRAGMDRASAIGRAVFKALDPT